MGPAQTFRLLPWAFASSPTDEGTEGPCLRQENAAGYRRRPVSVQPSLAREPLGPGTLPCLRAPAPPPAPRSLSDPVGSRLPCSARFAPTGGSPSIRLLCIGCHHCPLKPVTHNH